MNQRKAGVILSYISTGVSSIVALVYVPMLLHYLTREQYGIYQLMGSLIAYLSVMDFGLSNTTTRYLSQAYAQQDAHRVQHIINSSFALYLAITGCLLLLGFVFYGCITPIYKSTLSVADLSVAKQVFLVMLFNIALTIPANIFKSAINAQERFVFLRGLNLIQIIIQPLMVWAVLAWKASVLNLVLTQTVVNILVIFLNYFYCKKSLRLSFSVSFRDKPLLKELLGFSFFIFLHCIVDQVYWRLAPLILGAVSGAAAVASYTIALQVALFAIFLPTNMSGVFLPKLSALATRIENLPEINAIFCRLGRLQFMCMMLLVVGFAFVGKTFIQLWVGPEYSICYWITLILIVSYILDVSQSIGIPILQAMKKHAFRAYVYIAMALLNTLLCFPLAIYFGEIGGALSTGICLTIGSGFVMNWYYVRVGLNMKQFFKEIGRISVAILGAIICIKGMFVWAPIQPNWFSFLWHGVAVTCIYLACLWLGCLNDYEKQLVIGPIQKLIHTKS